MEFRKQQAIYLQIGDHICENILAGLWQRGEKLPSVREMAVSVAVNPNTVMRTYTDLMAKGILYNRRGIGFFVADDARKRIVAIKKNAFLATDLPRLFRTMALLGIGMADLQRYYAEHARQSPQSPETPQSQGKEVP